MTKKKMDKYEFTGVMMYAHCFSFEIDAKNPKEATLQAEKEVTKYIDPASAEFQEYVLDKPILISDE